MVTAIFTRQNSLITYKSSFSKYMKIVRVDGNYQIASFSKRNTENIFRKYYGKKVRELRLEGKPSSSISANRYKALKRLAIYFSVPNEFPSRSINYLKMSFTIFRLPDEKPFRTIQNISRYKHLNSLDVTIKGHNSRLVSLLFYKQIRTLNHLQSLTLNLTEKQLMAISKCLLSMKSLKLLKLSLTEIEPEICLYDKISFYSQMIRAKNLDFLKLDLQTIPYQQELTNSILQDISQTNMPSFNILLRSFIPSAVSDEDLDAALNQCDVFNIICDADSSTHFTFNTNRSPNTSLNQAKKSLGLKIQSGYFGDPGPNLPCNKVLKGLEELFRQSAIRLIDRMPKINNIANLKSLSFDFATLSSSSFLMETLFGVLTNSRALEHLSVYNLSLGSKQSVSYKLYESIFREISSLERLEKLEMIDFTIPCDTISLFTAPLQSLLNLRECCFQPLLLETMPLKDFPILFPESSKLTELYVRLPLMEKESKVKFIKTTAKLRELQKLTLLKGLQLFDEDQTEKMLIKTLMILDKLREVSIEGHQSKIIGINEKKKEADKIVGYVEKLFEGNKSLEKV